MLFYRTYGKGLPVIILHGLYGSSDNWVTIGKMLANNFKVIIPDQRNHGQSFHHPEMNFQVLTEDLKMFADELKLQRFYIIGHSMGGKVAANFMQQYPEYVEKTVLVDISPYNSNPSKKIIKFHHLVISVLNDLNLASFSSRQALKKYLESKLFSELLVNFLMKNFSPLSAGGFVSRLNISAIKNNVDSILGEVPIAHKIYTPIMIIKGGASEYFKAGDFQNIKTKFPNARMKIIPETTHWLHAEKPKEFYESVYSFLKS